MYYELIILGTLMGGPFHGYLIVKIMQNVLGPYGKLSKGRLYPLLQQLEEGGVIVAVAVSEKLGTRPRLHIAFRGLCLSGAGGTLVGALVNESTLVPTAY